MIRLLPLFFCIFVVESTHNLTFMFITSFGQFGFNASGVVPAADIALEDINNNPNVLSGYHLIYDQLRDSQCHRGRSLDAFFRGILSDPPTKLAIVGCGCSVATEPVAEISHQWNISHISYSSSSVVLSDRSRFRAFFRNTFNMQIIAPALRSAVAHFNWTRIALLTQDEGLFTGTQANILKEFESAGISVKSEMFKTDEDPTRILDDFFTVEEDYRVFFLNAYAGPARRIICYAYLHNYTYPRYAWMMYDWYLDEWWTSAIAGDDVIDCKDDELAGFLDKALTIQLPDFTNETTNIGILLSNFNKMYEERARRDHYNTTSQAYKLYDVMWALALALNSTDAMIKSGTDITGTGCEDLPGSLVPLEMFDYPNKKLGCLIQWNIQRTNFSGLTGRVTFDENGTRIHTLLLYRHYQLLHGGQLLKTLFAHVDGRENFAFIYQPGIGDSDIYPSGPPLDGTPIKIIRTFKLWLIVIFDCLASLGIVFVIVCLVFNTVFRKRKTIKLSSPTLNYFIIFGALLMYVSIFFYMLPTESGTVVKARCVVEYWLFTIGYSLAFGAVFMKMWRVYQIFHNPQPKKTILTDWKLIIIVLVIAGVAVILLLIGEAVPNLRGVVVLVEDAEQQYGMNSLGVREVYCVWLCQQTSTPSFFWQIFIFVYLFILQVVGIVLAFQTRKVKLRSLKDSKYVASIVCISSISIVIMALITFVLRNYINIGTGILAFGIFTLTTVFLALIFIPKMILLYKDPHGKDSAFINSQTEGTIGRFTSNTLRDNKCEELEKKVTMLENVVLDKDRIIAELRKEIHASNSVKPSGDQTYDKENGKDHTKQNE